MAISANNSNEEVAGGVSLFTGVAPVQVVAVNPTKDELEEIGVKLKEEPSYSVAFSDEEYNKISFWVKHENPDMLTRVEILVQPKHRVSKAGDKYMWTNNRAQITWAESNPSQKYDWYKAEGERKAYVGEDVLLSFIKAWANVAGDGDCYLETIDKIVAGDVSELKQLVNALSENRVRVLFGVKDGKYQQAYTKHFGRLKPQRDDLFIKELNGDYGAFNAEFNPTLELSKYTPQIITPDNNLMDDVEEEDPMTASGDAPW